MANVSSGVIRTHSFKVQHALGHLQGVQEIHPCLYVLLVIGNLLDNDLVQFSGRKPAFTDCKEWMNIADLTMIVDCSIAIQL